MKIFIDFDDVILNTKKFKEDLFGVFSAYGISKEEYENSYYDPNDQNPVKLHSIGDQIQRLRKNNFFDEKALRKDLENFFTKNTSRYVFADVFDFAASHKNDEMCVLTFGNKVFQEKKITNSKIREHIANIIITDKNKASALQKEIGKKKFLPEEKIFFIDDRTEQLRNVRQELPDIITIFIKRPEGRFQEMTKNEYCDFEVHNLREAEEIIKSLTK